MSSSNTRIAVAIRLRPLLPSEFSSGHRSSLISANLQQQILTVSTPPTARNFHFDLVLDEGNSQAEVYERCGLDYLVGRFVEGYNVTVLAYGQTGAGKTYTMEGLGHRREKSLKRVVNSDDSSQHGLIPRVLQSLLRLSSSERTLSLSFLQLYKEHLSDLLTPNSPSLKMRWNHTDQFYVEGLSLHRVETYAEALRLYQEGLKGKVMAAHLLNSMSSRSHCVLTIVCEGTDKEDGSAVISRLHLVDLAGSERVSLTGNSGEALKDSIDINKSLFTLRQVITLLSSKDSQNHIPYRDSKLTSLLKQSIGGNSYCLMLACLNPCNICVEESLSTLVYAAKAASIANVPIRNLHPKALIAKQLKTEVVELRAELAKAQAQIAVLSTLSQQPQPQITPMSTGETQTSCTPDLPPALLTTKMQDSLQLLKDLMATNRLLREQLRQQSEAKSRLESEALQVYFSGS